MHSYKLEVLLLVLRVYTFAKSCDMLYSGQRMLMLKVMSIIE